MNNQETDVKRPVSYFPFGVWLTVCWAIFLLVYMAFSYQSFSGLEPNAVGDFLAGLFAPLAFLWLVVGLLQQGQELKLQYYELKKSVDQYAEQSDALRGAEKHAKQSVLNDTRKLFERDLSSSAAIICNTIKHVAGRKSLTVMDRKTYWWESFAQGDSEAIVRNVYGMLQDEGAEINDWAAAASYINLSSDLARILDDLDDSGALSHLYERNYYGQLAKLLVERDTAS